MPIVIEDARGTPIFIDPLSGREITPDRMQAMSLAAAQQAGVDPATFANALQQTRGFDPAAYADTNDPLATMLAEAQRMRSIYDAVGDWNVAASQYVSGPRDPQNPNQPGTYNGAEPKWKPKAPIKDVRIFGNRVTVIYDDPTVNAPEEISLAQWESHTGIKYDPRTGKPAEPEEGDETVSPTSIANNAAALQRQREQQSFTAAQNEASRAESQRQFDEQFHAEKAKFNIQQNFTQAVQKWNEARDARDFEAQQYWAQRADYWKQRGDELDRLRFNEDTRQFDARFGEDQRQFEFGAGARRAESDIDRGKFLLGLGSRPATLGRYLYALQGLQAPQGFDFEPPSLPGFGPNFSYPTPGPRGAVPPAAQASTVSAALPGVGATGGAAAPVKPALPPAAPAGPTVMMPGVGAPGASIPTVLNPDGSRTANAVTTFNQPGAKNAVTYDLSQFEGGVAPDWFKKAVGMARGGVIAEPVIGMGTDSGLPYMLGEEGTEYVVPEGKSVSDVKGRRPGHASGRFAAGGMLGFDDDITGTPTLPSFNPDPEFNMSVPRRGGPEEMPFFAPGRGAPGRMAQSVFNPPRLGSYLGGAFLRPGIPNFPTYSKLTGGTSLLSNVQRLSRATPSELDLFSGFLQDEAGVLPDDVFALTQRMAPRGGFRSTRYAR